MKYKNPYTWKLVFMIVFSFFLITIFSYFSSDKNLNKNIEANDVYIHKSTIGNACLSSYIEKIRSEKIKITYDLIDRLENRCK